jgi:hypothetical protein
MVLMVTSPSYRVKSETPGPGGRAFRFPYWKCDYDKPLQMAAPPLS